MVFFSLVAFHVRIEKTPFWLASTGKSKPEAALEITASPSTKEHVAAIYLVTGHFSLQKPAKRQISGPAKGKSTLWMLTSFRRLFHSRNQSEKGLQTPRSRFEHEKAPKKRF